MAYQGTFAIITAALISGAIVERMRFGPYVAFIALWTLLVYAPVAHWVWGGGWLMSRGVLDFAGGTVVHINAGVSRRWWPRSCSAPGRTTGARPSCRTTCRSCCSAPGLLWFGWFGFNGGSALAANELAALAFTNTFLAPMATLVVWTLLDYFRTGRATAVGGATGIVVGLVAITPAAGFVSPLQRPAARRPRGVPQLLRHRAPLPHPARRLARRVRRPRRRRHHRRAAHRRASPQKVWNPAGNDGLLFGNPGQLGDAGARLSSAPRRLRRRS